MIDNGADVTHREGLWGFALWAAVWYDHYDVAELRLQHGRAEGPMGSKTPLECAIASRNFIRSLLEV